MDEKFQRMLVVGFDGLDYEKIKKYNCDNLMLSSFGKLDLQDLPLKTPTLWASMITGKMPEEHGIEEMMIFRGEKVRRWDERLQSVLNIFGWGAIHLRKALWYYIFDSSVFVPDKNIMKTDSVFEHVADSKALDVPGYSEYPYIAGNMNIGKLTRKHPPISKERAKRDIDAEHLFRKRQLFHHIGEHKLLMQHFHYSDWHQHMFLTEEKDKELYNEMNTLAGEILDKVDDNTLVLFCSDHGLEGGGHRDQAFYSTNATIQPPVTITNVFSKCLDHLDYKKEEDALSKIEI